MINEILMLAQQGSNTGITIGTGALALICGALGRHLLGKRNGGKYVSKELFDERTENISADLREIKVNVVEIFKLLRSKNQ